MKRSPLRWVLLTAAAALLITPAGVAWACVAVMSLVTGSSSVQAGDTVTVLGRSFAQNETIQIRLGSPEGQLLAVIPPPRSTMTSQFEVEVTLPADLANGEHQIVATQNYHHMNAGAPARATIYVGVDPPPPPGPEARPAGVAFSSGANPATMVLIGLVVAAAALALAAAVNSRSSGRGSTPEPASTA